MNIAINGFGRIGRAAFKILLEKKAAGHDINIVAINDLGSTESLSYLLKYDSVYGIYEYPVSFEAGKIIVSGNEYTHSQIKDPLELPWKSLNVDIVLECTGVFTKAEDAQKHITAGAKKVVLSAPSKDSGFATQVFGAHEIDTSPTLISNASCTTNCVTPVVHVLSKYFGVEKAILTTVHAYTATQAVVDGPAKKDLRSGRAAAINIIPESTGAAIATAKALPELTDLFDGVSLRVPVACGSISDITAVLKKNVTVEEINNAFAQAQKEESFRGILKYTEDPIVSTDIIKSRYSAIVDGLLTRVVAGNLVKVFAWYDNEWGYSSRLVEMAMLHAHASA